MKIFDLYGLHEQLSSMGWKITTDGKRNCNVYAIRKPIADTSGKSELPLWFSYELYVRWTGPKKEPVFDVAYIIGPEINLRTKKMIQRSTLAEWSTLDGLLQGAASAVQKAYSELTEKNQKLIAVK